MSAYVDCAKAAPQNKHTRPHYALFDIERRCVKADLIPPEKNRWRAKKVVSGWVCRKAFAIDAKDDFYVLSVADVSTLVFYIEPQAPTTYVGCRLSMRTNSANQLQA